MLRYIRRLEARDLSLTDSMIPLGSCTMKLNATTEMLPVSWREFNRLHPFAPRDQTAGYLRLFQQLRIRARGNHRLRGGLAPAQCRLPGRIAGLLVIRAYHESRGEAPPERVPDPALRARHQPGQRRDGGVRGGRR